jgi:hypothetical protein
MSHSLNFLMTISRVTEFHIQQQSWELKEKDGFFLVLIFSQNDSQASYKLQKGS